MENDEFFKIGGGEEYKDVSFGLYMRQKTLSQWIAPVIPGAWAFEAVSIALNEDETLPLSLQQIFLSEATNIKGAHHKRRICDFKTWHILC